MMNKNKLVIIGAGGHGRVVADIAYKMNKWQQIIFMDDDETIKSSMGIKVVGKTNDVPMYIDDCDIFVAIGDNIKREKILRWLEREGASIPTLIHPKAIIGEEVEIGMGTVIMPGAIINCCTKIGKGCIINTGATIDHDNIIEDYVHISPGVHLAGAVSVGKGTWLGIGSIVINNIVIISHCKIGAGAVVVRNINKEGTYIGIPATRSEQC